MSRAWSGGSTTRWRKTRAYVLQRDGYQCQIGAPGCTHRATHVDHIIPKAAGGGDDVTNLRAACQQCNLSRNKPSLNQPSPMPKRISNW